MRIARKKWRTAAALPLLTTLLSSVARCETPDFIEGFSHPCRAAEVAASTSGIVKEWLVAEADVVAAGQPLVQIDDTIHQSLVAIAEAAVASRGEIELAAAEQQLRRERLTAIQALAKNGHATPDELRRAQTEWAVASARMLSAQENHWRRELELQKLRAQSDAFSVTAPFAGVVTRIHRVEGEYVGPVEPAVCAVAELENLSARFLAPDAAVESLATGAEAKVEFVDSGQIAVGVATVSPYPDAETGMRAVQVKIANPQGVLKAGVRCRLLLRDHASKAN